MIRRTAGDQFRLVAQHDHALLAGQLAAHYGNARFAPPAPREETCRAVALHDCGWPIHDAEPTLNRDALPTDVFETPLPVALACWREATVRAAGEADYAQLLISLHVLGLSSFAANNVRTPHEKFDLNKFQHREIERQEHFRRKLGLATDIPLRLGLAVEAGIEAEEQLRRNHLVLQAMDRISLALLAEEPPFSKVDGLVPRPGAAAVTLHFRRTGPTSLKVEPWPFSAPALTSQIPSRMVPARPYLDLDDFRSHYHAAAVEPLKVTVHA